MESITVIENAIHKFYSTGQNDAHNWLLQFQNSNEAWHYVWELLNPDKPFEVQFFATNTLYAKISKQWYNLPESEQKFVQNQLTTAVKQQNLHKAILSSLCQSVSALLAHINCTGRLSDTSNHIIDDLVEIFPYNDPVNLQYLLETLVHIPVELEKKLGLEKQKLRFSLQNSWKKVLWLLTQVLVSCNGPVLYERSNFLYILGLECLAHWLMISKSIDVIEEIYPHLLQACERYLPSVLEDGETSKGFDLAQECLTRILTNTDLSKVPMTLWKWAKALVCLINDQNVKHYYEVLTAFGETQSRPMLLALIDKNNPEHKSVAEEIIKYLLACSDETGRYPTDERYSNLPICFWYSLQDDVNSLDKPQDAQALEVLKPIYARLSVVLLRKSELPLSQEDAGNADQREMFRIYRQDVADTYINCHRVLESEFLVLIGQRLSELPQTEHQWTVIESTIFAFKSVSECAWSIEIKYLEAILDLILTKIHYENYPDQVLASACSAIGSLSDWIGVNTDPWLKRCLQILDSGLTKSAVTSPPASMALIDVVRECGQELAPIAPSILETVIRSIRTINLSTGKGEGFRLMYIAGTLVGKVGDRTHQLHYLENILGYCILKLEQTIEESPQSEASLKNQFRMVGTFVSCLSGPLIGTVLDPVVAVFRRAVHNAILMDNPVVVEAVMESLNQCAVCVITNDQDAEPLAIILKEAYDTRPHPKAFKVMTSLINTCFKTKNPVIERVFTDMCILTLDAANACVSNGGNLSELCDMLHAFFSMLTQNVKKYPEILHKIPQQMNQMLQLAVICLGLPETNVNLTASQFLVCAILHDFAISETVGQQLVDTIVQCMAEKTILNNLTPHSDVLYNLMKQMPQLTSQWIQNALYNPSSPGVSTDEKDTFIRCILKHNTKQRHLEIIKTFGMLCRQIKVGLVHR